MTTSAEVRAAIEPAVLAAGCDLEDVEVRSAGRRQLVRVLIDADGGISLDTVTEVSRAVSLVLDEVDNRLGLAAYVLEVSSPGIGRPLTLPRHFRRSVDRVLAMSLRDGRTIQGRVVSATDESVTLKTPRGEQVFALGDITSAKVQVEFNRKANPVSGEKSGSGELSASVTAATSDEDFDESVVAESVFADTEFDDEDLEDAETDHAHAENNEVT